MTESVKQRTIAQDITLKGVGLHTGRKCRAVFKPAPENSGVKFVRTDLPGAPSFAALVSNVVDIVRGTTLGSGDARVYTIEHILSVLQGLEIDNLIVELDDSEPPVADGSSKEFVEAIESAGLVEQNAFRRYFTVNQPVEYASNQTILRIEPADELEIECEIDYNHPMVPQQTFTYRRTDDYRKEIAPARTFCFDYEIEALKKNGLAKGGSLDNAIVIGPAGVYNPSALRFPNEFVRHKILDLMGDLMLLGAPLRARVVAKRCGHGHNIKFLRQLLESLSTLSH
jgi:UDP-3-O-acyl N-acetylglucosamine deacetylase